jgi:hypothetical protein
VTPRLRDLGIGRRVACHVAEADTPGAHTAPVEARAG